MFIASAPACLLIPSGPFSDPFRKHLFAILTCPHQLPDEEGKSVLLVSFSTVHPRCDRTCVLTSTDHPFFKRESFAVYHKAIIEKTEKLFNEVRDGRFIEREPFSQDVLERVCQGLLASPATPPRILKFYRDAT